MCAVRVPCAVSSTNTMSSDLCQYAAMVLPLLIVSIAHNLLSLLAPLAWDSFPPQPLLVVALFLPGWRWPPAHVPLFATVPVFDLLFILHPPLFIPIALPLLFLCFPHRRKLPHDLVTNELASPALLETRLVIPRNQLASFHFGPGQVGVSTGPTSTQQHDRHDKRCPNVWINMLTFTFLEPCPLA